MLAGANQKHDSDELRAVIAHLFLGELARLAIDEKTPDLWRNKDSLNPLFEAYFLK